VAYQIFQSIFMYEEAIDIAKNNKEQ
jgi:hypothetical protein